MTGIEHLREIGHRFEQEKESIQDERSLDEVRARYLSRKSGLLTLELQGLRQLPKEQRAEFGQLANEIRDRIESTLDEFAESLAASTDTRRIQNETIDVSLPGLRQRLGHRHPITLAREETVAKTGFSY